MHVLSLFFFLELINHGDGHHPINRKSSLNLPKCHRRR
uniref:Uncharacterized protein n=1 Tax=Musa acuminata subsp. malaccensis TaxID=214687 RepID=A0A804K2F2_MUSAM